LVSGQASKIYDFAYAFMQVWGVNIEGYSYPTISALLSYISWFLFETEINTMPSIANIET
jgi:hypothetical protein